MATLEQHIKALEDENKARKASYRIAGGKVGIVMQTSQVWHKVGNNNIPIATRVKFQPTKISPDGISFTTLSSQIAYDAAFTYPTEDATSYNEPQNGDGSVVINILASHVPYGDEDYYIRVIAVGPSLGTFTLL